MCDTRPFHSLIRSLRCREQTLFKSGRQHQVTRFGRHLSCAVTERVCLPAHRYPEPSAPRSKSGRGLSHWHAPLSKQPKAPLHTEPGPRRRASAGPHGAGWKNAPSTTRLFSTLWRKLITRNKLISRHSFRINCIFTEVSGSDGSSSFR